MNGMGTNSPRLNDSIHMKVRYASASRTLRNLVFSLTYRKLHMKYFIVLVIISICSIHHDKQIYAQDNSINGEADIYLIFI